MRFVRALAPFVLLLAAFGCSVEDAVAPLPAGDLQAAPTMIVVDGQSVVLAPALWRDFMPVSPPDGQPLTVVLRVQASDRKTLTASLSVDAVWIVNGTDVWATRVEEQGNARSDPLYYEVIARDGPKWGPGIRVDVVVRVREQSGPTQLLRAADQLIARLD